MQREYLMNLSKSGGMRAKLKNLTALAEATLHGYIPGGAPGHTSWPYTRGGFVGTTAKLIYYGWDGIADFATESLR